MNLLQHCYDKPLEALWAHEPQLLLQGRRIWQNAIRKIWNYQHFANTYDEIGKAKIQDIPSVYRTEHRDHPPVQDKGWHRWQ